MIYFVDEDTGGRSAYPLALKMRGFTVTTIPDATQALRTLSNAGDVELAVVDVMLARGLDPERCFADDVTARGLQTGLRLLELLGDRLPTFRTRAVLLTAATDSDLIRTIRGWGMARAVPYWSKDRFRSTGAFCEAVEAHLKSLRADSP